MKYYTGTSSKRNGLAVSWISASSSKGALLSAMTVHGVTCIKFAGTVDTSEPNSLGKAMLYSLSHNARNSTQPAMHWNIPWQAGRREGTGSKNSRINDTQCNRSVFRMTGAVSLRIHGRCENLQPYNMQRVSVEMTTWKWLNHRKNEMLENHYIRQNKEECTLPNYQCQCKTLCRHNVNVKETAEELLN